MGSKRPDERYARLRLLAALSRKSTNTKDPAIRTVTLTTKITGSPNFKILVVKMGLVFDSVGRDTYLSGVSLGL
jgi:hypothetical protein